MQHRLFAALATLAPLTAALLSAPTAYADNFNPGPYAGDALDQLSDWGYHVMLNGPSGDAAYLSDYNRRNCQITGVHPTVTAPLEAGQFQTVQVSLHCPTSDQSNTPSGG